MRRKSVTIRISIELLTTLDKIRSRLGYKDRSELFEEALRRFVENANP